MSEDVREATQSSGGRPAPWGRRLLVLCLGLAGLALLALLVLGVSPSLWTLRATLAGSSDASAWTHVPAGGRALVACDVPGLMGSPIGRTLRPQLDALAHRHGFDASLAETNVRLLIVTADGPEHGFAVASGFRLSPLLLATFAKPWSSIPFGAGGARAATDGATVLVPLEPGIVAWVPEGVDPARVAASLAAAQGNPETPLPLDGAALRAIVTLDDRLRARAGRELPREAANLIASLERVDARVAAGQDVELRIELTHRDAAAAITTAALLKQANAAAVLMRGAGSLAALLGPDAALLALLPPLDITQDGALVRVEARADSDLVSKWLVEAENRLTR